MKNLRFILLLLFVFLILSSCGNYYEINEKPKQEAESETDGDTEYIVNTSSYTYHLPDCYIANNINEENKIVTTDIDFLVERQYTPCKKCIDN